jgi:hypothetical protein
VHQSSGISGSDVHARTLSDSVKTFENRQIFRGVTRFEVFVFNTHGRKG